MQGSEGLQSGGDTSVRDRWGEWQKSWRPGLSGRSAVSRCPGSAMLPGITSHGCAVQAKGIFGNQCRFFLLFGGFGEGSFWLVGWFLVFVLGCFLFCFAF